MGNHLKKNKKDKKKEEKKDKEKPNKKTDIFEALKKKYPDAIIIEDLISSDKIKLNLLNKRNHSTEKDPIEEIMVHPKFKNSFIIASKSGKIKLYSLTEIELNKGNFKETLLYEAKERIYSMILLKKNNNNIAIGLSDKILILSLNDEEGDRLVMESELGNYKNSLEDVKLLELENSNIISAGESFIYWINTNGQYNKDEDVILNKKGTRFINLVEFSEFNTIFATQEKTHEIYFMKYDKEKITLIKIIEDCSSIWYKGSAQKLSDYFMIMVGKFGLNVLDGENGEVCNNYPGIDKGTLLNLTQSKIDDNNIWIITDFNGKYFEFYQQEGNDLVFIDKIELEGESEIKWNNKLVRINNECFVAGNQNGDIFVFSVNINNI